MAKREVDAVGGRILHSITGSIAMALKMRYSSGLEGFVSQQY